MKICVVGLGYVGLPLAMNFAKHFHVIGFDIDSERINDLKQSYDRTNEFKKDDFELVKENIEFTTDEKKIKECDIVIVTVPTPTTKDKKPDLRFIENASRIVGRNLKKGAIVVYESTVYPGCTEEFALPILEEESGMKLGEFKIGYSPERVNPGDKEHTIDKITKIVAGIDEETTKILSEVYGKITKVYPANSIKVAEAAKVIENIQRDVNIALFNEFAIIFKKLGIDSKDVFDAASTKWNFLRFYPGFVGGHCLPEDPYYLASRAIEFGYYPKIILAGRETNDYMPKFVADELIKLMIKNDFDLSNSKIAIFGATYKENVPDLRESKVKDLINYLLDFGIKKENITIIEPLISNKELFGVKRIDEPDEKYDIIVYAVDHTDFSTLIIQRYLKEKSILIDIKRKFEHLKDKVIYWGL